MAIGNREVSIQGNTLARQIRTALADEILSGKLGSSVLQGSLYASAATPFLLFSYFLNGIDLPGGDGRFDTDAYAEAMRRMGADAARGPATPPVPEAQRFYFIAPRGEALPVVPGSAHPPFDVHAVRRDFPILQERVNGKQLVWFDNAATTHKPQAVIDRQDREVEIWMMRGGPLGREAEQRHRVGAAGDGERHVALAQERGEVR